MNKIAMRLDEAITAFGALVPHAAKNDVTNTLESVRIEDGVLYATDRFSVGKWETEAELVGEPFTIPRAAGEWIAKIKPRSLQMQGSRRADLEYFVTIAQDEHRTTVELRWGDADAPIAEVTQSFGVVGGNYPPVGRILATAEAAETFSGTVALSTSVLTKITANTKLLEGTHGAARFTATVSSNVEKPGPVRVEFPTEKRFTSIVQPNLITK